MSNGKNYIMPYPIIDSKEEESLRKLTDRYERLVKPNVLVKAGSKVAEVIPEPVKQVGQNIKEGITEQELYKQCMNVVAKGFHILEQQAAKLSVSEALIVKKISAKTGNNEIERLDEVCLARGYLLSGLVSSYRTQDLVLALAEGGVTGAFGFPGLPFNIVLSTFLFYRAVQSVAMFYGYDVKKDPAELLIASDVFMNALSPNSAGSDEISGIVGKVMVMAEVTAVKQGVKKTWTEMAKRGGATLLLAQMRALANNAAKKALQQAGKKGLEESVFKGVFEQIGKGLTKKAIGKAVPIAGGIIGGLFDTAMMNTVIEYADVFYNKRYLLEKEVRINMLIDSSGNGLTEV